MTNQNPTESKTPATTSTPDFSHRCADYPENNIIHATSQIQTVLRLLYPKLEPKKELPNAEFCTPERVRDDVNSAKQDIMDALFIIDSLTRDIEALANMIDSRN